MSAKVRLTAMESCVAVTIGILRQFASDVQGLRAKQRFADDAWRHHIIGAGGELAAAKYFGVFYAGHVNTFKKADLFQHIEVKTTKYLNGYLVFPEDTPRDRVLVLVTGNIPLFYVRGYITARTGKKHAAKLERGNYWVPQDKLSSIEKLRDKIITKTFGVDKNES